MRTLVSSTSVLAQKCSGYTLVETLVALTVVSVLLGLVFISPKKLLASYHQRQLLVSTVTMLKDARKNAIKSRGESVVEIDLENRRISGSGQHIEVPKNIRFQIAIAKSERNGDKSGTIRFFPDGSSTGGEVELGYQANEKTIFVQWLTGSVSVKQNMESKI